MGDTGAMLLGLLLAYGPISSTASLDQNILVNYASCKPGRPVPDDPAAAAADRDLDHPLHGPAAGGGPPDDEGHVAVRRRPPAPAPPAAEHGPLAPPDGAAHVPVGGPVLRPGGRPLGDQGPADLAGARHRRRGDRAGARDHAEAPPVAVRRPARRRDQEPSPDRGHPGPFDHAAIAASGQAAAVRRPALDGTAPTVLRPRAARRRATAAHAGPPLPTFGPPAAGGPAVTPHLTALPCTGHSQTGTSERVPARRAAASRHARTRGNKTVTGDLRLICCNLRER